MPTVDHLVRSGIIQVRFITARGCDILHCTNKEPCAPDKCLVCWQIEQLILYIGDMFPLVIKKREETQTYGEINRWSSSWKNSGKHEHCEGLAWEPERICHWFELRGLQRCGIGCNQEIASWFPMLSNVQTWNQELHWLRKYDNGIHTWKYTEPGCMNC